MLSNYQPKTAQTITLIQIYDQTWCYKNFNKIKKQHYYIGIYVTYSRYTNFFYFVVQQLWYNKNIVLKIRDVYKLLLLIHITVLFSTLYELDKKNITNHKTKSKKKGNEKHSIPQLQYSRQIDVSTSFLNAHAIIFVELSKNALRWQSILKYECIYVVIKINKYFV